MMIWRCTVNLNPVTDEMLMELGTGFKMLYDSRSSLLGLEAAGDIHLDVVFLCTWYRE